MHILNFLATFLLLKTNTALYSNWKNKENRILWKRNISLANLVTHETSTLAL